MEASRWHPIDAGRAWTTAGWLVVAVVGILGLDTVLRGVRAPGPWILEAVALLLALVALVLGRRGVPTTTLGTVLLYSWAVLGGLAFVLWVGLGGGSLLRAGPALALGLVAAGSAFPRRGLAAVTAVLAAAGLAASAVSPDVGPPEALLLVTALLLLGWLCDVLAGHLRRSTWAQAAARDEAERTSRVLAAVGRAATLDRRAALQAIVDATLELGGTSAAVELVRGGVRSADVAVGCRPVPVRAEAGVPGRAFVTGEVAVGPVDPSAGWGATEQQAAVPIHVDGQPVGVLVVGWSGTSAPAGVVELLPVLASHAGGALAAARQLADEQELVQRLRELDTMQRTFVTSVSHELRTPLSVVQGFAETLRLRGAELPAPAVEDMVVRLSSNADRLAAMLGGLLDFTRFGAGDLRLVPEDLDVALLVRAVLVRLEPVLGTHHVQLELEEDARVRADGALLEHVLENLVGNALKHTPAGTLVTVSVRRGVDEVEVTVADDGPGVPPAELPRLVDAGFRGSSAAEGRVEGSGLGLSLATRILRAHGSRLEVSSTVDVGTTFRFALPCLRPGAEVLAGDGAGLQPERGGRR
ncbi:MAG: ATP-binding protein [Actinomycetes bacterium]